MLIGSILGVSLYLSPITDVNDYSINGGIKTTVRISRNVYIKSTVSNVATYNLGQITECEGHPPIKLWIEIDF